MMKKLVHVLMIEDNAGDARLVMEALRGTANPAYRVDWVDRLSIGLARLADGGVDVVLLDLGLPDSQGLDALPQIRSVAPAVPVVVLSGVGDEEFAVEAVQAGAQDYVVKGNPSRYLMTRSLRYAIQRKRADEALRISEERLRLAVTAANESIWEYNPVTGITRWNSTYEAISGPETGPAGELWFERIHADERELVSSSFFDALEGPGTSWSAEYRYLGADGTWRNIHDRAVIARDSAGKASRAVGAMLDITGLKQT